MTLSSRRFERMKLHFLNINEYSRAVLDYEIFSFLLSMNICRVVPIFQVRLSSKALNGLLCQTHPWSVSAPIYKDIDDGKTCASCLVAVVLQGYQ